MEKITNFFKNLKKEYSKIIFPTKEKTLKDSGIVLVGSVIIGGIIVVLDFVISTGFSFILK